MNDEQALSLKPPIRFDESLEKPEADEAQTIAEMNEALLSISKKTFEDGGHAIRSVHAKSHAILQGRLIVDDGLPTTLAQGLFARPGEYPVVMRLSTTPGDILDDKVSTPRALAIKVLGVDGPRVEGSEGATTQDFVMVNGPAFGSSTAKAFLRNLQLLAKTTDHAPGLKQALSTVLQAAEKAIEAVGGKSSTLISLGGHPETNPLGETYFTQVPLRYGDHVVKLSVAPVSPALTALTDAKVDLEDRPNGLRDSAVSFFGGQGGEWEVRVQLMRDPESMPIEDAAVVWPEDESPYQRVGRIVVDPQNAWSAERSKAVDDGLAFSPWHALAAHRPLGSVMRARKATYEASKRFRAERNGTTASEPPETFNLP